MLFIPSYTLCFWINNLYRCLATVSTDWQQSQPFFDSFCVFPYLYSGKLTPILTLC